MEGDRERDLGDLGDLDRYLLLLYEGPEWWEGGELMLEWGDIDGDILLEDILESLPIDTVLMVSAAERLVLAVSCNICRASLSLGLQCMVWNSLILDNIISTTP